MFWKTEESAIDKLLGAQRVRQNTPAQICREFDPDSANAYIEHSLTTVETTRYEQHLSACGYCRKSVVMLSRMAAVDPVFSHTEVKSLALAGKTQTGLKRWFGVMTAPQWAMAAAAVLVIAISLPFLFSGSQRPSSDAKTSSPQPEQFIAGNQSQSASGSQYPDASGSAASNTAAQPDQHPNSNAQARAEKEQEGPDKDLLAVSRKPGEESPSATGSVETAIPAPPQPIPTVEPRADATATEQTAKAAEQTPPAAATAPSARREEPQLPKIDPEAAKTLAQDKNSAQVSELATGVIGGEESKKKEATIREESNNIPPPPPKTEARGRTSRTITQPGTAFRDSNNEAARSAPGIVKVGGRKFWLKNDFWTDKDYNPDKEMPMVTVFRDSDVYRELLSKHSGMKPFLTGFAENTRVIFIYKGTVYKLIPQEGSK